MQLSQIRIFTLATFDFYKVLAQTFPNKEKYEVDLARARFVIQWNNINSPNKQAGNANAG